MKKIIILSVVSLCILLSYSIGICQTIGKEDSIKIEINLLNSTQKDTVFLETFSNRWNSNSQSRYKAIRNNKGLFIFHIPVNYPVGYWQAYIYDNKREDSGSETIISRPISIPFIWELGDNISCEIQNTPTRADVESKYIFKGRGKDKYSIKASIESSSLMETYQTELSKETVFFNQDFSYIAKLDVLKKKQLQLLSMKQDLLTPVAYDMIKSDILYKYGYSFYLTATKFFRAEFATKPFEEKVRAISNFKKSIISTNDTLFCREGFQKSLSGIDYLFYRYKIIVDALCPEKNPVDIYNYIKQNTEGKLRENMLTYLVKQTILPEKIDSIINDSKPYFTSKEGKIEYEQLKQLINRAKLTSTKYILFDLNNESFELDLSSFTDKIVFVDFYYTGCMPCRRLYQDVISKVKKRYESNSKVLFLAVSIDRKYDFWLKSVKMNQYTSISSNTINLFAGPDGIKHSLFIENNINRFPMTALFKNGKILYYNTENLFTEDTLVKSIENLL